MYVYNEIYCDALGIYMKNKKRLLIYPIYTEYLTSCFYR